MICQKCGKQINDDYKMCPYCGTPVHRAVNTGQFQQNQQNNGYNFRNPQMPQSGSYNYGNRIQYTNHTKKNNTIGILALIFGIVGLLLSCIFIGIVPAIAGIVLGIVGISKNNGKGMCVAGLICGIIGILVFAIMLFGDDSTDSGNISSTQPKPEVTTEVQAESEEDEIDESEPKEKPDKVDNESESEKEEKSTEKSEKQIRKEFIDSCQEFDYKKIARNPDDYVGQNFKVTVQISSISTGGWLTDGYMKAFTDDGSGYYFDNMIYIFDDQDENSSYYVNVLEDDVITVYGTFEGMVESQNALNGEKSDDIALHMKYAELISE
ncbi:MAG: zinc-ribbon domain-containing protein [Agathobacter sp.]|nr:zinc-ribbon domain-containing protein [Agathobacter sp.]